MLAPPWVGPWSDDDATVDRTKGPAKSSVKGSKGGWTPATDSQGRVELAWYDV